MSSPKPSQSLVAAPQSLEARANNNEAIPRIPGVPYTALVGKDPSLRLELRLSTREICTPLTEVKGALATTEELEIALNTFSRHLKSELTAALLTCPPHSLPLSAKFNLTTTPDIALSKTAREAITELCLWDTPVAAETLDQFIDKSGLRLRPVLTLYRAATDLKFRSH